MASNASRPMKGCATSRTGWAASRRAATRTRSARPLAVLGQAHALILLREGRQVGEVARVVGDDRDEGVGAALALLGDDAVERHPHLEPDPVARTLAGQQQAERGGLAGDGRLELVLPGRAGVQPVRRPAACRPRPSARRPAPRGWPRSRRRASPPARCRRPRATGTIGAPNFRPQIEQSAEVCPSCTHSTSRSAAGMLIDAETTNSAGQLADPVSQL